jgi:hypothetical protein
MGLKRITAKRKLMLQLILCAANPGLSLCFATNPTFGERTGLTPLLLDCLPRNPFCHHWRRLEGDSY